MQESIIYASKYYVCECMQESIYVCVCMQESMSTINIDNQYHQKKIIIKVHINQYE